MPAGYVPARQTATRARHVPPDLVSLSIALNIAFKHNADTDLVRVPPGSIAALTRRVQPDLETLSVELNVAIEQNVDCCLVQRDAVVACA